MDIRMKRIMIVRRCRWRRILLLRMWKWTSKGKMWWQVTRTFRNMRMVLSLRHLKWIHLTTIKWCQCRQVDHLKTLSTCQMVDSTSCMEKESMMVMIVIKHNRMFLIPTLQWFNLARPLKWKWIYWIESRKRAQIITITCRIDCLIAARLTQ